MSSNESSNESPFLKMPQELAAIFLEKAYPMASRQCDSPDYYPHGVEEDNFNLAIIANDKGMPPRLRDSARALMDHVIYFERLGKVMLAPSDRRRVQTIIYDSNRQLDKTANHLHRLLPTLPQASGLYVRVDDNCWEHFRAGHTLSPPFCAPGIRSLIIDSGTQDIVLPELLDLDLPNLTRLTLRARTSRPPTRQIRMPSVQMENRLRLPGSLGFSDSDLERDTVIPEPPTRLPKLTHLHIATKRVHLNVLRYLLASVKDTPLESVSIRSDWRGAHPSFATVRSALKALLPHQNTITDLEVTGLQYTKGDYPFIHTSLRHFAKVRRLTLQSEPFGSAVSVMDKETAALPFHLRAALPPDNRGSPILSNCLPDATEELCVVHDVDVNKVDVEHSLQAMLQGVVHAQAKGGEHASLKAIRVAWDYELLQVRLDETVFKYLRQDCESQGIVLEFIPLKPVYENVPSPFQLPALAGPGDTYVEETVESV